MKMNITVIFPTAEKSRYFHQTFLSLNKNYYLAEFSFCWVIMKVNWDNTENLAEIKGGDKVTVFSRNLNMTTEITP